MIEVEQLLWNHCVVADLDLGQRVIDDPPEVCYVARVAVPSAWWADRRPCSALTVKGDTVARVGLRMAPA